MSPVRLPMVLGVVSLIGVSFAFAACTATKYDVDGPAPFAGPTNEESTDPSDEEEIAKDEDQTLPDTPPEVVDGGEVGPDDGDAGPRDGGLGDAGDAGANPCVGQKDGFAPVAKSPKKACCGGKLVDLDKPDNCGSCGLACAPGRTCGQVRVGEYSCTCAGNLDCTTTGAGATCYATAAGSFCNCQCPNNAATCSGACIGGATCHDITGQNYCSY